MRCKHDTRRPVGNLRTVKRYVYFECRACGDVLRFDRLHYAWDDERDMHEAVPSIGGSRHAGPDSDDMMVLTPERD